MKTCSKCKAHKPETEFSWKVRKAGIRAGICKICFCKYAQEHYKKNKAYYLAKNARQRTKISALLRTQREATPCVDCGVHYPYYVMEFDNIKERKHHKPVSSLVGSYSRLVREMARCDNVCANCHAIRTWKRRQAKKGA